MFAHAASTARSRSTEFTRGHACTCCFDFLQTGGLALQTAQVIELGAPNFRRTHHVDLVDDLRVDREDTLDALAEADLADGETRLCAVAACNDDAFKRLQALFFAFANLDRNLDRVAGTELRADRCAATWPAVSR